MDVQTAIVIIKKQNELIERRALLHKANRSYRTIESTSQEVSDLFRQVGLVEAAEAYLELPKKKH